MGLRVEKNSPTGSIKMTQEFYVKRLLEKFNIMEANPVAMLLEFGNQLSKINLPGFPEEDEMKNIPYRELMGGLNYLQRAWILHLR